MERRNYLLIEIVEIDKRWISYREKAIKAKVA